MIMGQMVVERIMTMNGDEFDRVIADWFLVFNLFATV